MGVPIVITEEQERRLRAALELLQGIQLGDSVNTPDFHIEDFTDTYVALPPCGETIPAMVGLTPGVNTCCIFKLVKETSASDYKLEAVRSSNGSYARYPIYNIYDRAVTDTIYVKVHKDKYGRYMCERPPSTADTTTPDPGQQAGCTGTCLYRWDTVNEAWDRISSNCAEREGGVVEPPTCLCPTTTTTTTLAPGVTTTSTSTTTTTSTSEAPCDCPWPPRCGTELNEEYTVFCVKDLGEEPDCYPCAEDCIWAWNSTLKTWERFDDTQCTGANCLCEEPDFCGDGVCFYTRTTCVQAGSVQPQPHCGASTTTTSTTSSTTTTPEGCGADRKCTWYNNPFGGIVKLSDTCDVSCPCSTPEEVTECETVDTPCVMQPPTTTCGPSCGGSCVWFWHDVAARWYQSWITGCSSDCLAEGLACACQPPTHTGACGEITSTDCGIVYPTTLEPTTTTGPTNPPTTTTPDPESCTGRTCKYRWSDFTSSWDLVSTQCRDDLGCPCSGPPDFDGGASGECATQPCRPTTTSTTTSTSTTVACICYDPTTTLGPGATSACFMQCIGGEWTFVNPTIEGAGCSGGCPASCFCTDGDVVEGYVCSAEDEGAVLLGDCQTTTTSSTTTSTSSTCASGCGASCGMECVDNVWTIYGDCDCLPNCTCESQPFGAYKKEGDPCAGTALAEGLCRQTGACCDEANGCTIQTANICSDLGGTYQGNGTDCDPNPCGATTTTTTTTAGPVGACCKVDDCTVLPEADCDAPYVWQGEGTDCDPNPCAVTTTTAEPTTTTTTAGPGGCGTCPYMWDEMSLVWVENGSGSCTEGCNCVTPPGSGSFDGQTVDYPCA
jgi:hypothetical protein